MFISWQKVGFSDIFLHECFGKIYENEKLNFFVHDMLKPLEGYSFDFVLNLFTSFGYFDELEENVTMLKSIHSYLESDGELIIDFMNAVLVERNMVNEEVKTVDGIDFMINRSIQNGFIEKSISFSDKGESYNYKEKVRNLRLSDFEKILKASDFKIVDVYGNYQLEEFNENKSDRLIICVRPIK